ncbi:MAG TPA: CheR family methyltransferase, partial [Verrucomicrobiae bacterium]|nr:CheR family methyltransferase [Verrucomicrobiae bacterium]
MAIGGGAKGVRGQAETKHAQGGEDGFKKILLLLRNHSGVDFSLYKSTTIQRRITRRTVLSKQNTLEEYSLFLKGNAKELDALYSDVLINVTSFFRNPDAFDLLKRKVFPKLLEQRGNDPLRVWVLGCSTGQEAYSIAMAFTEVAENAPRVRKLQVFATDLNDAMLDKARHGLYAKTLAEDVSPDRLRRFFVEEAAGYRIIKPLREMVVFARQNLINDPPFSRMDLISCRNLLIYLEPSLQKKVIPTFHYALKPEGFLFLGGSESVSGFTDLFEPADKKHKIYSKKAAPAQTLHLPVKKERGEVSPRGGRPPLPLGKEPQEPPEGFGGELNAQREADRVSVNQFVPPGVLINAELQIVQFRGPTGAYLQPPSTGKANFDVLKMAREGLLLPLRAVINKARKENKTARREKVRVQQNGKSRTVNLEVSPLKNLRERCFLILFEDAEKGTSEEARPRSESRTSPRVGKKEEPRRINALETELSETRDYLQSIQEQHEAANEELQASNEEVQSANEELQSVNEELETSKEELESANEELTTVNEEMANRNTELNRLNADLSNLQTSTKLPIVLVGRDLAIRRFSASAEKIFNLLTADLGRPLSGVRHNLVAPKVGSAIPDSDRAANDSKLRDEDSPPYPIENLIREVIDTVRDQERDVRDRDGRWYSLRVRPYMTVDNKVDGAVLVLMDITDLKRSEQEIKDARNYAEATIRTARDPLLVLRADLRVNTANEAFYKTFKVAREQTENCLIYELGNHQWDIPKLRMLLEDILPRNSFFNDFEVTHDFPQIGRRVMLLNARRLDVTGSAPHMILVSIEDVTERLESRAALRESEERYRALFDLNPVAVYTIDASGVIQNFNRHASELWGRQPVPGDTDERFCGSFKMFRPDGTFMPHDQCPMAEVVSGKIPAAYDAEVQIERPDGSRVTVIVNIRPLKNDRGEVIGAINCFYDITERKQAAEQLHVSEIRYRRLFETAHDGILIIDSVSRKITDANPFMLELLGYRREELRGKELWEIGLLKDEQASHAVFRQLQQYGLVRYDDLPLQTKTGEKLDVEVIANHYKEDGSPVIQCNVRNITGRKRSEKELAESLAREQAAHRAKDDFLAALSHELRTPLNPVLLVASDSAIDPDVPEHIRANFDMIRKNIELEARLIDDLLDLTRITHGKLIINQSEQDVHEIVKDAISNVLNEIEHKRIILKLDLRAESHTIFGDAVRLQQVFWNVLKNAVKFTPEGGQITI